MQVKAFARRARLEVPPGYEAEFTRLLAGFLWPVLCDVRDGVERGGKWENGGTWQ